ncbi:MAG: hypothetical protein ACI9VS_000655 [Candidatus Binatia bacterium]|jgi:hypothetical protein
MEKLPPEFSEFLRLLARHDVKHMVIGGYAVAYYGYSRFTADIDIWIEASPENADRVLAALHEFGFDMPDLNREHFIEPGQITRMGVPPMRIEILTDIDGVDFHDCFNAKESATLENQEISFISLADLKRNKAASGRAKDLADLDRL